MIQESGFENDPLKYLVTSSILLIVFIATKIKNNQMLISFDLLLYEAVAQYRSSSLGSLG